MTTGRKTQASEHRDRARHAGGEGQLLIRQRLQADRAGRLINEGTHARRVLHVFIGMPQSIDPIGNERGSEQGTGNNAQQIHTPIVRYLGLRGKPNGPAASKQQVESGVTHMA